MFGRHARPSTVSTATEHGMDRIVSVARRHNWLLALALALTAAFVYRGGFEEAGAVIWFVSLVLLLPIWRQPT
jgi:hypothetical protein